MIFVKNVCCSVDQLNAEIIIGAWVLIGENTYAIFVVTVVNASLTPGKNGKMSINKLRKFDFSLKGMTEAEVILFFFKIIIHHKSFIFLNQILLPEENKTCIFYHQISDEG